MRHSVVACLLFVLSPLTVLAETFEGKVVGISDGDSISVLRTGRAVKVRLWRVDAPETGQAYGTKAKQFTSDLVFGRNVTVVVKDTDQYGRLVGLVKFIGKDEDGKEVVRELNLELVKAGMAWWYKQFARYSESLTEAEEDARKAKRGLWVDPSPVAPWDYRKNGGLTARLSRLILAA